MTTTTETRNFKEVKVSTVVLHCGKIETIIFYNGSEAKEMSKVQDVKKQHEIAVKFAQKATLSVENFNVYLSI